MPEVCGAVATSMVANARKINVRNIWKLPKKNNFGKSML